ncbi:hypothetical protein [Cellulomonas soli]
MAPTGAPTSAGTGTTGTTSDGGGSAGVADGSTAPGTGATASDGTGTGTGTGSGTDGQAAPVVEPEAALPASVDVALPASAGVLEAGATAQDLPVDVTNSGGTATGALTATVTLPAGLSLDGVAQQAASSASVAGFAPAAVSGWLCVPAADAASASCVLGTLGPRQTARLSLRVSVDEAVEGTDTSVAVVVEGRACGCSRRRCACGSHRPRRG